MRTETRRLLTTTLISTLLLGGIGLGTYFAVKNPAPGTTIAGHAINSPSDAPRVVGEVAKTVHQQPIRIEANGMHATGTVESLGVKVDEALMVTIAQQHTGLAAWVEALTSGSASIDLETYQTGVSEMATKAADELTKEPVNGNVSLSGAEVRTFAAEQGKIVTPEAITKAVETAIKEHAKHDATQWPDEITVKPEIRDQDPPITQAVVDQTAAALTTLVTTPFTVTNPKQGSQVELGSQDIAGLLTVQTNAEAPDPKDRLAISMVEPMPPVPSGLTTFLAQAVVPEGASAKVVDRSPSPAKGASEADLTATSTITGRVAYDPGATGLLPDSEATWKAVGQALARGEHTTALVPATDTASDLSAIGVTRAVSTYTTFFTEGQQRNTNIKRVADLVNGTIIAPGAVYELNHAVGPRTAAKGFVEGGAIFEGKLTTSLGGGVSQFATTFFNAAWFSGVQINTFKPHTYYFERYPLGREATIDYPGVNLEIQNNTPYAILVEATTTATSVTVTFWSTPYFKVDQQIGKPVPANGGTNVTISRTATAPDGKVDQFKRTVHYRKQPTDQ